MAPTDRRQVRYTVYRIFELTRRLICKRANDKRGLRIGKLEFKLSDCSPMRRVTIRRWLLLESSVVLSPLVCVRPAFMTWEDLLSLYWVPHKHPRSRKYETDRSAVGALYIALTILIKGSVVVVGHQRHRGLN